MDDTPKKDVNQKTKQRSNYIPSTNPKGLSLKEEFKRLKMREKELDEELELLVEESKTNTQLKSNMEQLHIYNDVKDATQIVLGSLARLENVTVTELHAQFGLSYVDNDAGSSND